GGALRGRRPDPARRDRWGARRCGDRGGREPPGRLGRGARCRLRNHSGTGRPAAAAPRGDRAPAHRSLGCGRRRGSGPRPRLPPLLAGGYPLVHIASHFVFHPGPLDRSFLLLGDGTRLTLEQLKQGEVSWSTVRLLALSACSTALGEGGDGRELESFAGLAR